MSLRERSIVHTAAQIDLMLVVEIRGIDWKAATTPDELQVSRSLSFIECIEYAPESNNDLISGWAAFIHSDSFKAFRVNCLFACASPLQCLPIEEVKDVSLVLNDFEETFTNHLDLLFCFFFTSCEHFLNEIIDVCLSDLDIFSVRADWYFVTTWEYRSEVLIYSILELFIAQSVGILLHVAKDLCWVSVDSFKVLHCHLILQDLLPDPWSQIERYRRFA